MDLDDILSDKPEKPEAPAAPAAPAAEAPKAEADAVKPEPAEGRKAFQEKEAAARAEGRPRDASGKFIGEEKAEPEKLVEPEKVEPVKEPAKPVQQEMSDKERALLAAATDERRKRQQLEQEFAQFKAQQVQQPQTPAEPAKTFWDDPEAALRASEQRVAQQNQQLQQNFVQQRLASAEAAAKTRYQDFDAMVPIFGEILQANPGMQQHWLASPDPAEYAYRAAKSVKELRDAGSVEAVKAQALKEARISVEAEYKAKEEALKKEREALPGSLSDARGTSQPRVTWGGPPSLDQILKPH